MRFEVTSDDHIREITEDLQTEADKHGNTFATEQELHELAGAWPMKRLIEIWNHLSGVQAVQKFENRQIATGRIWRALQPRAGESRATVIRPARTAGGSRIVFREGSKAAEVCRLLRRPDGATLEEIQTVTGWQAHTVRGFISRTLHKQGRRVRSFRKDGGRVYRLKS
jgi:Protein of unknown function (DUF3489)